MLNVPIPQLSSDMVHQHGQGIERTPVNVETPEYSERQSIGVVDGMVNACAPQDSSPGKIVSLHSSPGI
jgi:hypothetical protein